MTDGLTVIEMEEHPEITSNAYLLLTVVAPESGSDQEARRDKLGGKNEMNNKSVVSLTLGILSIVVPLIGLVLGILGVVFSRNATKEIVKTNESGKGLATSGLICSVVGIVIQLFIVFGILAYNSISIVG